MLGTDYILNCLVTENIDHLFMVPGGLIDPFLPAIGRFTQLKPIVAAQEGGAAFMADGYARATGKFGAALCIGGPGLTNTATAIAAARTDGSAVLLISGEVATAIEGFGMFQDASYQTLDDIATLKQMTQFSSSIPNPKNLNHLIHRAMIKLLSQPRGPVHISLPKDSQVAEIDATYDPIDQDLSKPKLLDLNAARDSLKHFTNDKKPVRIAILAGSGVDLERAHMEGKNSPYNFTSDNGTIDADFYIPKYVTSSNDFGGCVFFGVRKSYFGMRAGYTKCKMQKLFLQ